MRIIFMGSPEIAVKPLLALINSTQHTILSIYTKFPSYNRKKKLYTYNPIHQIGISHDIEVNTTINFKNQDDIHKFLSYNADVAVVFGYGIILPTVILNAPKYQSINLHPSILPRWRGAAPIQNTIMHQDTITAMSIIKMVQKVDSGDILTSKQIDVLPHDTTESLSIRLSKVGADLLLYTLNKIENDTINPIPQSNTNITFAPKLSKLAIDWTLSANIIEAQIRALGYNESVYFLKDNENIKILEANYTLSKHNYKPGTIMSKNLDIACKIGILKPLKLQRPGKKIIDIDNFIRGFRFEINHILS